MLAESVDEMVTVTDWRENGANVGSWEPSGDRFFIPFAAPSRVESEVMDREEECTILVVGEDGLSEMAGGLA